MVDLGENYLLEAVTAKGEALIDAQKNCSMPQKTVTQKQKISCF
jgi:hypothetical protein